MAFGRNPSLGCTAGCNFPRNGWVPLPSISFPRRDALIDAVNRMESPCDRPGRCPPCCKPVPKYGPVPESRPECNICDYREEQEEDRLKEQCEIQQKAMGDYFRGGPEGCEGNNPIVAMQLENTPQNVWSLKEVGCKTDIIAGFFNPNDNLTADELERKFCDPFYRNCGPDGLAPYPCRGVIKYPPQRMVSLAEENRQCLPEICQGSKFLKPEYLAERQEYANEINMKRQQEAAEKYQEILRTNGYTYPHPCCPESLSQTPYCRFNPDL